MLFSFSFSARIVAISGRPDVDSPQLMVINKLSPLLFQFDNLNGAAMLCVLMAFCLICPFLSTLPVLLSGPITLSCRISHTVSPIFAQSVSAPKCPFCRQVNEMKKAWKTSNNGQTKFVLSNEAPNSCLSIVDTVQINLINHQKCATWAQSPLLCSNGRQFLLLPSLQKTKCRQNKKSCHDN